FYEKQEQQKETEELHDEPIVQSDLTDDENETIAFNNETVEEKPEAKL
ncbi:transcription termination/antitermination protein NusA, partial [Enterococcus faecium]